MNLPVQPSQFIGRVLERQAGAELLRAHRLLTLLGAGGSGKTRLAIQLATDAGADFPDGAFWVPLAAIRAPSLVAEAIARSVSAKAELGAALGDQRVLLVLDNMEQVVGAASLVASLLVECPNLKVLATSREPLRIMAEQRYVVRPLNAADAVALFVDRARAVDPGFQQDASVDAICTRLDCLPLAVELAATRVSALTPRALLERLDHALPLLTGGTRDMPDRHQTMRATIEWSEALLSDEERQLLHRLSIFHAGFDLAAAEQVCAADLETLFSLVDKCLVGHTRDRRFTLLETIREFADAALAPSERDALAKRHGEYFVATAETSAGMQSWPPNPERFGVLDEDLANLRAALEWTRASSRNDLTLRLGIALSRYWIDRGHHHDAFRWLQMAALGDLSVSASLRAAALEAAGVLDYFVAADIEQAEGYYTQSLAIHRELGNQQRVAFLLNRLGRIAIERGDLDLASDLHREALGIFEDMADNAGRAATVHLLASVAHGNSRYDDAEALYADAIRMARTSFPTQVRHSLHSLGDLSLDRGDYLGAAAYYERSLEVTGIHERRSRILCIAGVGSALAGLGENTLAASVWGAVEAEERALGFRMLSDERKRYERWADTVRKRIGDAAFVAAAAVGQASQLEDVLNEALSHVHAASPHQDPRARRLTSRAGTPCQEGRFQREGEYWTIVYVSSSLRLRDSKGVRVLAHLLADPGRPYAALDLERLGAPGPAEVARAVASSNAGDVLDDEARREYRAPVAELREAIDTAEAWGKADEAGLLREEMDFITHELSRALGLGGRPRRAGSIAERARVNVVRAVRSAMLRISAADADFGAHLRATIHTGTVCVYTPDPRVPITWRVTDGDVRLG
jgi:predicted ATPase